MVAELQERKITTTS